MKKISLFSICLLLITVLSLPAFASEALPFVVDNADLLTAEEEKKLEEKAQGLSDKYASDFVILTVQSLGDRSAQVYADNYFDENGYGYGTGDNGVLLLLAMDEREWYISTCGEAIYALTDYGIGQLGDAMAWFLSNGYYFDAFEVYLDALPAYFAAYDEQRPVDGDVADYLGPSQEVVYYEHQNQPNLLLSLIIGAVSAAVVILIMRSSMNTKKQQHGASVYLKEGSFHLRSHQDLFLYSKVSKTRRQQNTVSSGGSSVHRSSSGRRHGGGGGRF